MTPVPNVALHNEIRRLIASRPRSDKAADCLHAKPQEQVGLSPEEQAKRDAEWEEVFAEYERINGICEPCADEDCDFYKLKGCTKRNQIKNSLGSAKELIQCPKNLLYKKRIVATRRNAGT